MNLNTPTAIILGAIIVALSGLFLFRYEIAPGSTAGRQFAPQHLSSKKIGDVLSKLGTRDADMFSFKTLMDNASSASRWISGGRKAEPTAPQEVRRIPRRQFDAVMGGAKAAMRDLTEFAKQAKSRLREDRPIKQDDLLDLLRKLIAAQKRIDSEIESTVAKSADMGDTEWDRRTYNLFAFPTSRMANSLQAIVDGTLAASNNGAKDVKLLYELTVSEMDVAVARFNVTLSFFPDPPSAPGDQTPKVA